VDPATQEVAILIQALDADLWSRYPAGPIHGIDIAAFKANGGVFLVLEEDGAAHACGAYRPYAPGVAEIKRMFVHRHARGRGYSRRVLAALEDHAIRNGFTRVVLETGDQQPEAIGLYESAGYARIPRFGEYIESCYSICFSKILEQKDLAHAS
jgi:GNAT superfamily N-acetyltransferase